MQAWFTAFAIAWPEALIPSPLLPSWGEGLLNWKLGQFKRPSFLSQLITQPGELLGTRDAYR